MMPDWAPGRTEATDKRFGVTEADGWDTPDEWFVWEAIWCDDPPIPWNEYHELVIR